MWNGVEVLASMSSSEVFLRRPRGWESNRTAPASPDDIMSCHFCSHAPQSVAGSKSLQPHMQRAVIGMLRASLFPGRILLLPSILMYIICYRPADEVYRGTQSDTELSFLLHLFFFFFVSFSCPQGHRFVSSASLPLYPTLYFYFWRDGGRKVYLAGCFTAK